MVSGALAPLQEQAAAGAAPGRAGVQAASSDSAGRPAALMWTAPGMCPPPARHGLLLIPKLSDLVVLFLHPVSSSTSCRSTQQACVATVMFLANMQHGGPGRCKHSACSEAWARRRLVKDQVDSAGSMKHACQRLGPARASAQR